MYKWLNINKYYIYTLLWVVLWIYLGFIEELTIRFFYWISCFSFPLTGVYIFNYFSKGNKKDKNQ